jgi:hypothetical protein
MDWKDNMIADLAGIASFSPWSSLLKKTVRDRFGLQFPGAYAAGGTDT